MSRLRVIPVVVVVVSVVFGASGQQTGQWPYGGVPFPEGKAPDGTRYKTDYRCEGQDMTVSCEEDETIQVVRGNFGRFSIAICNRHGHTNWNVNCFAPDTTKILSKICDGRRQCVVPVDSQSFGDPCPGTLKYLEIHYACSSTLASSADRQKTPYPPWLNKDDWRRKIATPAPTVNSPEISGRKPILVTEKAEKTERRIPITTPRPTTRVVTTTKSTTTTTSTTTSTLPSTSTEGRRADVSSSKAFPNPINRRKEVFPPSKATSACSPATSRNLQWNWTEAGQLAIQPCPIGTTGLARWLCEAELTWSGAAPDMSDCKSVAMTNLESKVNNEDPENVLISSLAYLTRTRPLYGGDLESAVAIMRLVASRITYRLQQNPSSFHGAAPAFIQEVLQNVVRSASHILERTNRDGWNDFDRDRRMKVATSLLLALEENAFLLASVLQEPEQIVESSEIMTMTILAVPSSDLSGAVSFPPRPLLYVDDDVRLSAADLRRNSLLGTAEAVFFSYTNLHEILSAGKIHVRRLKDTDHRLNSRVVSASLAQGRHIELTDPVRLSLRHLDANLSDPVCVFWDYEVHGWSDNGCQVVDYNRTHTTCQCDHLTNFAVLMRSSDSGDASGSDLFVTLRLDIVLYVVAVIIVVIVIIVICIKFRSRLRGCCSACCRQKNDMQKCQSFYTGFSAPSTTSSKARAVQQTGTLANNRTLSQYVLTNAQLQGGHPHARTLTSKPTHITLNPYSTQLVENLNMMMANGQHHTMTPQLMNLTNTLKSGRGVAHAQQVDQLYAANLADVYRAVSPHGHVYWEIDPSNQTEMPTETTCFLSDTDADGTRPSDLSEDDRPRFVLAPPPEEQPLLMHPQAPPMPQSSSSSSSSLEQHRFVRTGANRYRQHPLTSTPNQNVPEQLQCQVQIKDLKRIPVSVRSSEYIEAKISTFRKNNKNNRQE